MPDNTVELLNM